MKISLNSCGKVTMSDIEPEEYFIFGLALLTLSREPMLPISYLATAAGMHEQLTSTISREIDTLILQERNLHAGMDLDS